MPVIQNMSETSNEIERTKIENTHARYCWHCWRGSDGPARATCPLEFLEICFSELLCSYTAFLLQEISTASWHRELQWLLARAARTQATRTSMCDKELTCWSSTSNYFRCLLLSKFLPDLRRDILFRSTNSCWARKNMWHRLDRPRRKTQLSHEAQKPTIAVFALLWRHVHMSWKVSVSSFQT